MDNTSRNCTVTVVEHPTGISQPCKICHKILASGKYTVGIILANDVSSQSYFICGPETVCCGEKKTNLIFLTDILREANLKADEVTTTVESTGDTSSLSLIHANMIVPHDPRAN